jgi:protein-disulfide isomerase
VGVKLKVTTILASSLASTLAFGYAPHAKDARFQAVPSKVSSDLTEKFDYHRSSDFVEYILVSNLNLLGLWHPDKIIKVNDSVTQIVRDGTLEDVILGNPNAPNTIIEYVSMTCPHCADFHATIFNNLKRKYIDAGKVRYIVREFPLDTRAGVVAMLLRCADRDRFLALFDVLFNEQEAWASVNEKQTSNRLLQIFNLAGMSKEQFNRCLRDEELLDSIVGAKMKAQQEYGVESTPTLFVNGRKLENIQNIDEIEVLLMRDSQR